MENNFYYIWVRFKYNGNDVYFLNTDAIGSSDEKWNPFTNDLDEAFVFSHEQATEFCKANNEYEKIIVQDAQRIACLHVSASKMKKEEIKDGEPCLLLTKRDQCGKNAAFWFYNGSGYGSDIRASQIYKYKIGLERSNREFEYFVKFSKAIRYAEKRVDIQDINDVHERDNHHSVSYCRKLINKQTNV